jgi:hypothetical protein
MGSGTARDNDPIGLEHSNNQSHQGHQGFATLVRRHCMYEAPEYNAKPLKSMGFKVGGMQMTRA